MLPIFPVWVGRKRSQHFLAPVLESPQALNYLIPNSPKHKIGIFTPFTSHKPGDVRHQVNFSKGKTFQSSCSPHLFTALKSGLSPAQAPPGSMLRLNALTTASINAVNSHFSSTLDCALFPLHILCKRSLFLPQPWEGSGILFISQVGKQTQGIRLTP